MFLREVGFRRGVAGVSPAEGVAENARVAGGWSVGETSPLVLSFDLNLLSFDFNVFDFLSLILILYLARYAAMYIYCSVTLSNNQNGEYPILWNYINTARIHAANLGKKTSASS